MASSDSYDSMEGIVAELTQLKLTEDRMRFQSRMLELLVSNASLTEVLDVIARHIQQESPTTLCSILLMADDAVRLRHGAAPSLPVFYIEELDSMTVSEPTAVCPSVEYWKQRVIAEDLQTHAAWTHLRNLTARANLCSCWSEPILSANGQLLGAFVMYYREPHVPNAADVERVEWALGFTRLAIEHALGRRLGA